jgi:ATP-dependent Lon protease
MTRKTDKLKSKSLEVNKKRKVKHSKKADDSDDDSSIDSKGNIRGLIDYDYTSDEDDTMDYETSASEASRCRSPRPLRKSAIVARKKISNQVKQEMHMDALELSDNKTKHSSKKSSQKPTARLTPSKRKYPFKSYEKQISNKKQSDTSYTTSEESEEYCTDSSDENDDTTVYFDEEEYDENEDEEDEEDEGDENTENEQDESNNKEFGGIVLTLGTTSNNTDNMTPKKYNMKKEPEIVKKFVKLLTEPVEENTIDTQIYQFKTLSDEKQLQLVTALEKKPTVSDTGINLMLKILTLKVNPDIQGMILSKYNSLQTLDNSSNEYFKLRSWLEKVVTIPFGIHKDIPVRLEDGTDKCTDFMKTAKKYLDDAVYGQDESKLQIMQFISTKITNPNSRGLSLLFIGPPGIGKTTIIKNGIAKALDWPFQFISLGGDSDASTYTGHQLVYESSHCGKIVNSLIASKSMSTVLMFDEIDKISQTPKGEEVMNLLIHLTDSVQNAEFEDKYLSGIPIDLSKVMFVFSANDITKIDKILLDRMTIIDLKGYDLKEKTTIAEQYLLPVALKEVNLEEKVEISKDILTQIIQEYANEEKGVRELKRCIEQITQKINMLRMYNSPELPFHIKDFKLPFNVKKEHIKLFLKKKDKSNSPPIGMYI